MLPSFFQPIRAVWAAIVFGQKPPGALSTVICMTRGTSWREHYFANVTGTSLGHKKCMLITWLFLKSFIALPSHFYRSFFCHVFRAKNLPTFEIANNRPTHPRQNSFASPHPHFHNWIRSKFHDLERRKNLWNELSNTCDVGMSREFHVQYTLRHDVYGFRFSRLRFVPHKVWFL